MQGLTPILRRRSRGGWVLALLAILFWVGVEFVLRILDVGYPTSFFVEREINGRRVVTDNQFFGYRFFPPRMARTPPCIVFDREKAPGTIRIFVLGESAAMGDPLAEFGLARHLACLLKAKYPGRHFEVINAAMTAIHSPVIVEIAEEAARFQHDVFVLYIGNNEIVGPYGPGTVFGPFSGRAMVTRARMWATRWRLSQLLQVALRGWAKTDGLTGEWEGLDMFSKRQMSADDSRLGAVRSQFRLNIERILAIARGAGAESILCTVAVNLRDFPPLGGSDALNQYRQAEARAAAGSVDEANEQFAVARDLDTVRVRADGGINDILREVVEGGPPLVRFVDAERRFQELAGGRVPGNEVFLDHVHFNFAGNHALALEIAEKVAELPSLRDESAGRWLSLSECQNRLLYTVWNELDLTDLLLQRTQKPPFNKQPNQTERIQALMRHREGLLNSMRSVSLDELRPVYQEAMKENPNDWVYPLNWSAILYNGSPDWLEEAERTVRLALSLAPHRYDHRAALALVLGLRGRPRDGIQAIVGEDRKGGWFPALYLSQTGRVLAHNGKASEAVEFFREAIHRDPGNVRAELELAKCWVALGQPREAEVVLRNILTRDPAQAEATEGLGHLKSKGKR